MEAEWSLTWQEVARQTNQLSANPPFRVYPVGSLTCKICGGKVRYGTGWEADGWMCGTRRCLKCNATHIITDSLKFCRACYKKDAACLSYPQIFIRKSD